MEAVALHNFNPDGTSEDELPFRRSTILKVIVSPGKKITEGIATTPVTESLAVSANTALSQNFGLRHITLWMLPLNYTGQLDIPKDHNFEWFLFRRIIIPKIFIPKGHYSEFRNNDPLGQKIFGIMTLGIKCLK